MAAVLIKSQTPQLADRFGRVKRKLRVSLTDRCNLRCPYCMPDDPSFTSDGLPWAQHFELIRTFVVEHGITDLRLTGGEPLLRKDLENCIADLNALRPLGLQRISLTSNGILLPKRAKALKAAGLDDINISLDALEPEAFAKLSGGRSNPQAVIDGILAAQTAGLSPKLNTVLIRGYNVDQILPLTQWAMQHGIPLRFIEFMPLDGHDWWSNDKVVPEAEVLDVVKTQYALQALPEDASPARYYTLNGDYQLGIISTVSRPFCKRCDRLRLTADGHLYTCLFSAVGQDLSNKKPKELNKAIRQQVWNKDAGYAQNPGVVERPITMHHLGG